MELRHLRYFIAVAEELHFGKAAEKLHIAQPPLSQQIKALEEELGVQLLLRNKRKVELTPAGALFLKEARSTVQQSERAKRIAVEASQGIRGTLKIGFVTSSCYSVLPKAVRCFRRTHPLIDLEIMEMVPSRQVEAVLNQEIDAGILRPPVKHPRIQSQSFFSEHLCLAVPSAHRLASEKSVRLQQLAEEAFVLFPQHHGPGIYDVILQACQEAGFVPNISYSPNEMQTVLAYVAAGLGISLVPESLKSFHPNEIQYLPLRGIRPQLDLAIMSKADIDCPNLNAFRDILLHLDTLPDLATQR